MNGNYSNSPEQANATGRLAKVPRGQPCASLTQVRTRCGNVVGLIVGCGLTERWD